MPCKTRSKADVSALIDTLVWRGLALRERDHRKICGCEGGEMLINRANQEKTKTRQPTHHSQPIRRDGSTLYAPHF